MVLRDVSQEPFWLKIDGKWVHISTEVLSLHPGGSAITTYKNRDATAVFHAFHAGSKPAFKMLADLRKEQGEKMPEVEEAKLEKLLPGFDDVNMGEYNLTEEGEKKMIANFERLRWRVRQDGLMDGDHFFYFSKLLQCIGMIAFAVLLQYYEWYVTSALILGLAWQQLGWMIHEYCHHQHFKNRFLNDCMSYVTGNLLQGFSSGGWKEQHNVHHAATNVVGRDGDIDLMPLWATVPGDLKHMDDSSWISYMLPYQHIYWTMFLPGLRFSWLIQSIQFVSNMPTHFYKCYRDRALPEQITLGIHWFFVLLQLYYLPDMQTRAMYFFVSQLFAGFLLAHVVTYNHYSTEKFHHNAKILDNYPCLQLCTTRNMRPGLFIDWLWGGLNYQIEHHLFPTMPRHNLPKAMVLVKEFCAENDLPYMVDDYFTGWKLGVEQFENVARLAAKLKQKLV